MTGPRCGVSAVEWHDPAGGGPPGRAACRAQGRCPGHLRLACHEPAVVRIVSVDGLSVQYACRTHVRVMRAEVGACSVTDLARRTP